MSEIEELEVEGDIVEASVLSVADDEVIVHLGHAGEGFIPLSDFKQKKSDQPRIEVGESFRVFIDHKPEDGGRYLASRDKAIRIDAFTRAKEAFEKNQNVEGQIVASVEGGFNVDIGVKAFLPASQFGLRPLRSPDQVLGHSFQFKIIRFNESRHNIVVSRRVLLEAEREAILDRIQVGAIVEGRVKSLVDYGAFIDVGG